MKPVPTDNATLARMVVALTSRENEYDRISRILHDEVGQVLSAVGLQLDVLRLDFRDQVPEIEARTGEIQGMLERVIEQLRELSHILNPSIVERTGLQFALDRMAGRVRKMYKGNFRVHFEPGAVLPGNLATAFYKIAEKAVEDAVERASAKIELFVKRAHGNHVLEIRFDGLSAAPSDISSDLRSLLMEHYASESNLKLTREESAGRITIHASHPVSAARADKE